MTGRQIGLDVVFDGEHKAPKSANVSSFGFGVARTGFRVVVALAAAPADPMLPCAARRQPLREFNPRFVISSSREDRVSGQWRPEQISPVPFL
jgi:hypothetical protein